MEQSMPTETVAHQPYDARRSQMNIIWLDSCTGTSTRDETIANFATKLNNRPIDNENDPNFRVRAATLIPQDVRIDLLAWATIPGNVLWDNNALQATLAAAICSSWTHDDVHLQTEFSKLSIFWKLMLVNSDNAGHHRAFWTELLPKNGPTFTKKSVAPKPAFSIFAAISRVLDQLAERRLAGKKK